MRVVADTNTLVSGFLWDGLPARLLDAGLTGRFGLYSSTELLSELGETLRAPKFAERLTIRGHNAESLVRAFRFSCHEVVSPPRVTAPELRDSDDLHGSSRRGRGPCGLRVCGPRMRGWIWSGRSEDHQKQEPTQSSRPNVRRRD